MRISTSWAQQLGVNAMNAQQVKLSKTQMQLSTGLNILTPSDDPAASVRILTLQETIAKTEQYQDNIAMVRSRLNIEETSIGTAEEILFRAKELTVQALNASVTPSDRFSIKYEIDQMLEQMVAVANTKNANGEYIFSGDLSTTPPFAFDGEIGEYVYQGGINQRTLDIAPARRVADGDLGDNVFIDITSVSQTANSTVNGTEVDQRSIFNTLQTLSSALAGQYDIPEATITGDRFMRFGVDYSATGTGSTSFTLTGDVGSAPITLSGNYTNLEDVVSDINSQIPAASQIEARSDGNNIEFISLTEGKDSTVTIAGADAAVGDFLFDFGFSTADTGQAVDLGGTLLGNKTSTFLDYATSPASFELVDQTGNKQTITLSTNYADNNALIADIQSQITGSPIDGSIEVDPTANPIQFNSISSGTSSSVTINQLTGDFLVNAGFTSGVTSRLYKTTLDDVLTDLDFALDRFLEVRTSVGARMNALDEQEIQNEKFVLDMKTTLSEVQDLDYAEAISRFNLNQTALQAAQQTFSQVQNLSLFNFI